MENQKLKAKLRQGIRGIVILIRYIRYIFRVRTHSYFEALQPLQPLHPLVDRDLRGFWHRLHIRYNRYILGRLGQDKQDGQDFCRKRSQGVYRQGLNREKPGNCREGTQRTWFDWVGLGRTSVRTGFGLGWTKAGKTRSHRWAQINTDFT